MNNEYTKELEAIFGKPTMTGNWICSDCGHKYGRYPENHISTWHIGKCDYCGQEKAVTEPRDFRHPKLPAERRPPMP